MGQAEASRIDPALSRDDAGLFQRWETWTDEAIVNPRTARTMMAPSRQGMLPDSTASTEKPQGTAHREQRRFYHKRAGMNSAEGGHADRPHARLRDNAGSRARLVDQAERSGTTKGLRYFLCAATCEFMASANS